MEPNQVRDTSSNLVPSGRDRHVPGLRRRTGRRSERFRRARNGVRGSLFHGRRGGKHRGRRRRDVRRGEQPDRVADRVDLERLDDDSETLGFDPAALAGTNITTDGYDPATGLLVFSGVDSPENYQQVLRTVTYVNTSTVPKLATRQITFTPADANGFGNTAIASVTMLAALPADSIPPRRADVQTPPSEGSENYDFTVTYIDDRAIDVSTLDSVDVRVTGPMARPVAVFVGVDNGRRNAACGTYEITAPGGTWDAATDSGEYMVSMEPNQVADTAGNPVPAGLIGDFGFNETVPDTIPRARATAADVVTGGGSTYTFTVTYLDDVAIDTSTLDSGDVKVAGQPVTFIGVVQPNPDVPLWVATYQITPPGGTWDAADNGSYAVVMQADEVQDTSSNPVAAGTIGTFSVAISPNHEPAENRQHRRDHQETPPTRSPRRTSASPIPTTSRPTTSSAWRSRRCRPRGRSSSTARR